MLPADSLTCQGLFFDAPPSHTQFDFSSLKFSANQNKVSTCQRIRVKHQFVNLSNSSYVLYIRMELWKVPMCSQSLGYTSYSAR